METGQQDVENYVEADINDSNNTDNLVNEVPVQFEFES